MCVHSQPSYNFYVPSNGTIEEQKKTVQAEVKPQSLDWEGTEDLLKCFSLLCHPIIGEEVNSD